MVGEAFGLVDVGRGDAGATVEHRVGVRVERQARSVDRDAEEQAPGAGVGIDFGAHPGVGAGVGGAADRAEGHVGVGTEGDLVAAHHALEAAGRGEHEHDVGRLHAGLEAEAAAAHRDHRRRAPRAVAAADEQDALAVVDAQDEAPLDHVGEDRDALGRAEHRRGDRLDLEAAELVEHLLGRNDRPEFFGGRRQGDLGRRGPCGESGGEHGQEGGRQRQTHGRILSRMRGGTESGSLANRGKPGRGRFCGRSAGATPAGRGPRGAGLPSPPSRCRHP